MNAGLVSLVVLAVILYGIVSVLYRRHRDAAGPRERVLLRRTFLLCPVAGAAFGLLLDPVGRTPAAQGVSPGVLFMSAFPFLACLPAILVGRRLTQIRKEEGTWERR